MLYVRTEESERLCFVFKKAVTSRSILCLWYVVAVYNNRNYKQCNAYALSEVDGLGLLLQGITTPRILLFP